MNHLILQLTGRVTSAMLSVTVILVVYSAMAKPLFGWLQQKPESKKVLTIDDYGEWSRIDSASISPDGKWATYAYSPLEGDKTFFLRSLDGNAKPSKIPMGSSPVFSRDSKWLTYMVSPGEEESKKLKKSKKPIVRTLRLMNLETDEVTEFEGAVRATFPKEGDGYVAISMGRTGSTSSRSGASGGSDLLIVNLETMAVQNIGNVGSFQFNKSGKLLAYTVDAADQSGNGLYLMELESNTLRPLDSSKSRYRQLTWNKQGEHLAVLKGAEKKGFVQNENDLIVIHDAGSKQEVKTVYAPGKDETFPKKMVLSEFSRLQFSEDASMVVTGIKEQTKKPSDKKAEDEKADVDVWHWQDDLVQSVQQRRASRDRRSTYAAVFHVKEDKFVQLGAEDLKSVSVVGKGRWGVGFDDRKFRAEVSWGARRGDYYRVNLKDGSRDLIVEQLGRPMGNSPDGKYFVYLKEEQVWVYNLDDKTTVNLSKST
ncbi:MAG: hypothetical protein AAF939_12425, partial [Planctomycetota bacterium]